jgi:hypothetical protein
MNTFKSFSFALMIAISCFMGSFLVLGEATDCSTFIDFLPPDIICASNLQVFFSWCLFFLGCGVLLGGLRILFLKDTSSKYDLFNGRLNS